MPRLFGFRRQPLPGPRPFPVIGGPVRLVRFLDDPIRAVLTLREYGDVVALNQGDPALVAVFGPDRVKEVLGDSEVFRHDEEVFTGPAGSRLDKLRNCIVAVNADVHRRHRKLMMPAFKRSALDGYAHEVAEVTQAVLDRWPVGQEARVDTLVRELALCMAVRCFYGMDVVGGATELGHLAAEVVETLTDPFTILTPFNVPGLPYRRAVSTADILLGKLEELVERKRAEGPGGSDALSLLVHADPIDGEVLTDDELLAEATALFVAGHETVAMTLTWTLFLLERHPDELDRVLDEIEATVGQDVPTPGDFDRMPLLDRAIKESMRILPSVPTLFLRALHEDAAVGGVTLPKDANVLVSPLAAHHDPAVYPEPRKFRPDRWIDFTPPRFTYLPFGHGARICIGATFANQALRIMLPMILRRFRLQMREGSDVSRLTRANILLARNGLWMRIDPYHRERRDPVPITGNILDLVEP